MLQVTPRDPLGGLRVGCAGSAELGLTPSPPQHGRRYGAGEYERRLRVFVGNKRHIEGHNAGNSSFQSTNGGSPPPPPPSFCFRFGLGLR